MDDAVEPIQIPLTQEQQQLIQRLSGQFAQVLELTPDTADASAGAGRGLKFRWRLSVASGIPRQQWGADQADAAARDPSA
jgi:hypothetical protein